MQLHSFDAGLVRLRHEGFRRWFVNEDPDHSHLAVCRFPFRTQFFNNGPTIFRFYETRTRTIEIEAQHISPGANRYARVLKIRDAADLYESHSFSSPGVYAWVTLLAIPFSLLQEATSILRIETNARNLASGSSARIRCSPIKKPR